MYFKFQKIKSIFAAVIVFSILFGNLAGAANAQDITPFEELSLGSSVFIFRNSSRKPQFNSTSARFLKINIANRKLTKPRQRSKKSLAKHRKKSSSLAKTKSNSSLAAEKTVNKLFDKAVENYNQGRYKDAAATYKQVLALDATHPSAHANLASSYRQLERYAEANAEYKIAADFIKDDTDMFSEWGFCLGKVNEWTKAVVRLTTAKELNADAINFANIGWAYLNAAQKNVGDKNAAQVRANFLQAKVFLQKAIQLNPQMTATFLNLGLVYNGLGEYQNAVETLTKANDARANWRTAINELGIAYRNSNNFSAAITQFEKATNLDNNFAVGYFNLGEAQFKYGKKKDALKTLEKLKKLDRDLAARLDKQVSKSNEAF